MIKVNFDEISMPFFQFEHLKSAINKSGTIKQMQQIMLLDVIIKKENLFDDDVSDEYSIKQDCREHFLSI